MAADSSAAVSSSSPAVPVAVGWAHSPYPELKQLQHTATLQQHPGGAREFHTHRTAGLSAEHILLSPGWDMGTRSSPGLKATACPECMALKVGITPAGKLCSMQYFLTLWTMKAG